MRADHPVVTGEGLVGRVSVASPRAAIVRLITDHTTNVRRAHQRQRRDRRRAPSRRAGPTELVLRLHHAATTRCGPVRPSSPRARSRASDSLTSLYPPNVPIGTVTRVDEPGTDDQEVHVRPFADLRRLEFVQVLTRAPNRNRPAA